MNRTDLIELLEKEINEMKNKNEILSKENQDLKNEIEELQKGI
jgi:FtsZ-binding cell division protein ZapB